MSRNKYSLGNMWSSIKSLSHSKTQGAFTIVEVLIVVVMLSILMAAVIPRLRSVESRARDTERISDIRQIWNGLNSAALSHGSLPTGEGLTSNAFGISGAFPLVPSHLTAIPAETSMTPYPVGISIQNPSSPALFSGLTSTSGQYAYIVLPSNKPQKNGVVLLSRMENRAQANRFGNNVEWTMMRVPVATPGVWTGMWGINTGAANVGGLAFTGFFAQSNVNTLEAALCKEIRRSTTALSYVSGTISAVSGEIASSNICFSPDAKGTDLKYVQIVMPN